MQSDKGIGPRIAEARKAAGLTQAELAASTGNSTRAIQSWEIGSRHPRMTGLNALAEALDRDVSWFYAEPTEQAA